ncbi:MAG TPA: hypothetical protein VFQ77_00535 [Pseudonocardiaceae bacterium]|jgi:hypothetical protein|nr:hypothetical protein [Pseudonocardiaceae bacterium]
MQLTVRDLTSARQLEGLFILGQDIPHGVVAGHRADAAGINGANQGDHSAVLDVALIELARDAVHDFFAGSDRDEQHDGLSGGEWVVSGEHGAHGTQIFVA